MFGSVVEYISLVVIVILALGLIYWAHKLQGKWKELYDFSDLLAEEDKDLDEKMKSFDDSIQISRSKHKRELQVLIDNLISLRDGVISLKQLNNLDESHGADKATKEHLDSLINTTNERIHVLEEFHFYEYGRHHTLPYHLSRFRNYMNNGSEN